MDEQYKRIIEEIQQDIKNFQTKVEPLTAQAKEVLLDVKDQTMVQVNKVLALANEKLDQINDPVQRKRILDLTQQRIHELLNQAQHELQELQQQPFVQQQTENFKRLLSQGWEAFSQQLDRLVKSEELANLSENVKQAVDATSKLIVHELDKHQDVVDKALDFGVDAINAVQGVVAKVKKHVGKGDDSQ